MDLLELKGHELSAIKDSCGTRKVLYSWLLVQTENAT